jgi:predicted nuclease of predicted toxin-antitoxin system
MRFVVDECTGSVVAKWLRDQGHDVFSVYDDARGLDDKSILQRACDEERILVTCDKDFGELIFRDELPHKGVLLIRTADQEPAKLIDLLSRVLADHADQLAEHFVVATENRVRVGG